MGWVDRVPGHHALYIGGLYALYQTDLIRRARITHVLSVIDYDPQLSTNPQFNHLKQLHINVEDHPNTNLLAHFARTCEFIDSALRDGGSVFIHCAMGKSRSAACVVAFLMWKDGVSWEKGLERLCEGRGICDPNIGFKEQLEVWGEMLRLPQGKEREERYERWVEERFVGESWEWERRK
ncbi:phosphatases II, partial [Sporormia fimetaria CBS 119925]